MFTKHRCLTYSFIILALLPLSPGELVADQAGEVVCRAPSIAGFSRPHRIAKSLLRPETTNPSSFEALLTVENGSLYVHSNFKSQGAQNVTKIATPNHYGLDVIVANLLYQGNIRWDVVENVRRNGTFYVTPELRNSHYLPALGLAGSRRVYDVASGSDGSLLMKTLSPESRIFNESVRPVKAKEELELIFASEERRTEVLDRLERDLEANPFADWRSTPTGQEIAHSVRSVQRALHGLGEDVAVDGAAGPGTRAALGRWGERYGSTTIEELVPKLEAVVRGAQQNLVEVGIPVAVDGRWGRQTTQGVAEFQRQRGLTASGRLDQESRIEMTGLRNGVLDAGLHRFSPRERDRGHSLGRRLSLVPNLDRALASDPHVQLSLRLEDGHYAVKLHGVDGWFRVRSQGHRSTDRLDLEQGWVSDPEGGQQKVLVTTIARNPLEHGLEPGDYVVFHPVGEGPHQPLRLERIRGPPSGNAVDLHVGEGAPLAAVVQPESSAVAVLWRSVPESLRRHLDVLGDSLAAESRMIAEAAGRNGGEPPSYTLGHTTTDGRPGSRYWFWARRGEQQHPVVAIGPRELRRLIDTSNELAAGGKFEQALDLLEISGPSQPPEILAQKALLEIGAGRTAEAAETLKDSGAALALDRFEELPRWLQDSAPGHRRNGERARAFVQAREALARQGRSQGTLVPFFDGDALDFAFYRTETPGGRVLSPGEAEAVLAQDPGRVYVQDLFTPEAPAAFERSLRQQVSTGRAFIMELPAGEVGDFRPAEIYSPPGERFTGRTGATATDASRGEAPPPPAEGGSPPTAGGWLGAGAPVSNSWLRFQALALLLADDEEEGEDEQYRWPLTEPPQATSLYLVAAAPPVTAEAGDAPSGR